MDLPGRRGLAGGHFAGDGSFSVGPGSEGEPGGEFKDGVNGFLWRNFPRMAAGWGLLGVRIPLTFSGIVLENR